MVDDRLESIHAPNALDEHRRGESFGKDLVQFATTYQNRRTMSRKRTRRPAHGKSDGRQTYRL